MPALPKSVTPACPRQALAQVIDDSPYSYAELSRMLGRPDRYLRRFVKDGRPIALSAAEHAQLLDYFGLGPNALGDRELWASR